MHFNMKKAKFRRMSIISNSFDVRASQRVKNNKSHTDDDRKKDKQLLTPNIKRFLKTWLLDHKDYPYPDRYEKIMLAQETGLTIMQICNWFANWRRKLKLYSKDFKRRSYKVAEYKTDSDEIEDDSDDNTQRRTPYSYQNEPDQVYQPDSQCKPDAEYEWNRQARLPAEPREVAPQTPKIWRPQEDLCIENKDLMLLKWLKSISTFDSIKYHPCYTKYVWDSDRVKQMLHGESSDQYNFDRLNGITSEDHKYYDRLNGMTSEDHKYYDRLNGIASEDHKYYDRLTGMTSGDHKYYDRLTDMASGDHKYYDRLTDMASGDQKYYESLNCPVNNRYESLSSSSGENDRSRSSCDVHLDQVRQSDEILAAEILASFAQNRHPRVL